MHLCRWRRLYPTRLRDGGFIADIVGVANGCLYATIWHSACTGIARDRADVTQVFILDWEANMANLCGCNKSRGPHNASQCDIRPGIWCGWHTLDSYRRYYATSLHQITYYDRL